jgi:hypothetical protein
MIVTILSGLAPKPLAFPSSGRWLLADVQLWIEGTSIHDAPEDSAGEIS